MDTLQLVQYGAMWGIIFGLVFCAATLVLGRVNAAMLVNEYPPDVRAKFGAMDARTRRQANLASPLLLVVLGSVIALALSGLRAQTGELTAPGVFIAAVTMFQVWNLLDLLLLDWLLLMTLQPRFMILPGTEGMPGYRDHGFHFRKFLNGIVLTFVLGGIVTLIAMAVEWVV